MLGVTYYRRSPPGLGWSASLALATVTFVLLFVLAFGAFFLANTFATFSRAVARAVYVEWVSLAGVTVLAAIVLLVWPRGRLAGGLLLMALALAVLATLICVVAWLGYVGA